MMLARITFCLATLLLSAPTVGAQYHVLPATVQYKAGLVIPVIPANIYSTVAVRVNDVNITIDSVVCPSDTTPVPLHAVLAIDVSGSMARGAPNILLAKEAARSWIRTLSDGSTCAITSFDNQHYLNIDATEDTTDLHQAINRLKPRGGTSYRQGLLGVPFGALRVAATSSRKRVVVFLTDGAGVLDTTEVLSFALHHNITVYCVSLGMALPTSLRSLAERTGGFWFENITTVSQATSIYTTIAMAAKAPSPCYIYAQAPVLCTSPLSGSVSIGSFMAPFTAVVPTDFQQSVVVTPPSTNLGKIPPNEARTVRLTVKATGKPTTILNVQGATPYGVQVARGTLPRTVQAGQQTTIDVTVEVPDTAYAVIPVQVILDEASCPTMPVYVLAGSAAGKMPRPSIRIVSPNGGDVLTAKTKVKIEYTGIPTDVPVAVEASLDNGLTWKSIAGAVTGGSTPWTVPDTTSATARVRVRQFSADRSGRAAAAPLQEDASDAPFSIVRSMLVLRDVRFPPRHVGTVKDSLVKGALVNNGNKSVTLVALRLEGTQWVDFGVHTATPLKVAPGDSVAIELAFQPQGAGERATKFVAEFDDGQRLSSRVTGRALLPLLQASAAQLDFGDVSIAATDERFIKDAIVNTGRTTLVVRSVRRVGPDDTSFAVMSPSSFRLAPGESHTVHAAFHPVNEGRRSTAIDYIVDGIDEPLTVMLYGRGVDPATMWRDPTTFRAIALPTAVVPPAGTITLGVYDVAGVSASASVTDNFAILVGGMLPLSNRWIGVDSATASTQYAWSAGLKGGWVIDSGIVAGGGIQHGHSLYDRIGTPGDVESQIRFTALWATVGLGTDDSRLNLYTGYAFKHHTTAFTGRFHADATIFGAAYDRRLGQSWKICSEAFFMRTMPVVPITITARYFGESYAIEGGFICIAITAAGQPTPALPVLPLLSFVKRW